MKNFLLLLPLLLTSVSTFGVKLPQWELGISYVQGSTPHYIGSNHYYEAAVYLPYLNYRSEQLQLGDENIFYLLKSDSWMIDFSFSGRLPVRSDDLDESKPEESDDPEARIHDFRNYTRRGMENLPLALFAGVELSWYLNDHLLLEFPVVTGFPIGSRFRHLGSFLYPTISFDFFDKNHLNELYLYASCLLGDQTYNRIYYGVSAEDELSDRPAYDPAAGSITRTYGVGFKFYLGNRFILSAGYYQYDMSATAVDDSPLVITKRSYNTYLAFIYKFKFSDRMVEVKK